ncbi:class I SAM-dependent methyltransferase, partial [Kibdelosporangium lantanae]
SRDLGQFDRGQLRFDVFENGVEVLPLVRPLESADGRSILVSHTHQARNTVVANEIDPFAIDAIRLNAEANDVTIETVLGDMVDGDADGTDVLLAGDIFYDKAMTDRMMPFIARLRQRGATVLVGDPGRAHLPRERFHELVRYDVPVPKALEDAEVKTTIVFTPLGDG